MAASSSLPWLLERFSEKLSQTPLTNAQVHILQSPFSGTWTWHFRVCVLLGIAALHACAHLCRPYSTPLFLWPLHRSVKVIRLIGRDTVEEIVCRKAASKLQLTNTIIEGGHFTLGAQKPAADADLQVMWLFFTLEYVMIYSLCSLLIRK